jgi:aspartate aminotransferase
MTGWRCGWTLAPAAVASAAAAIQSHSTSNASSLTQKAVVAALTGSQAPVAAMLAEYRRRRDALCGWLSADPRLRFTAPAGAFYLFVDVSDVLSATGVPTSIAFAQALLDESRVAVTPGEAFEAPGYVRISFATSMENLREGAERLLSFAARRRSSPAGAGAH